MSDATTEATKVEPREEVPDVDVIIRHTDERKALADLADERNPKFRHVYKSAGTSSSDMFRHKLEVVKHSDLYDDSPKALEGVDACHRGDILCRQPVEEYERVKQSGESLSRQLVEQSMKTPDGVPDWEIGKETRQPRSVDDLKGFHK